MSDIILKSSLQENLVKNDLKRNIEDIIFLFIQSRIYNTGVIYSNTVLVHYFYSFCNK